MLFSFFSEILVRWIEFAPLVAGLLMSVSELRNVRDAQRLSNHLQITENHREIWSFFLTNPRLCRILEPHVDLARDPITNEESIFVTFLILHLKTTYRARKAKMLVPAAAVREDIKWLFALPIPSAVWRRSVNFQDPEFARFVEDALSG